MVRVIRAGAITLVLLAVFCIVESCRAPVQRDAGMRKVPDRKTDRREPVTIRFGEIWGYLLKGEEDQVRGDEPFTDLCYFCSSITSEGRLSGSCVPPALQWKRRRTPRLHMVVAVIGNPALVRMCLDPKGSVRGTFIADILSASRRFDGVQIDFESLPPRDGPAYLEFLKELRRRLHPSKRLSVAIPARRKRLAEDAYDYAAIAAVVDRVVVMAYDQHWSTSAPGPVASLPWCREVLDYSRGLIPDEKLIMGLPLYGRAWQDDDMHRALRYSQVKELLQKSGKNPSYQRDKGLFFEYEDTVKVRVFYDDHRTILEKLKMYRSRGVRAVSFWRIGQGPEKLWRHISSKSKI
ncbi:MAG: glycoside hydrolase [Spirochaetes bacterium]|nr:glycoside hydrolase [Spirochaetota bacterium]